MTYHGKPCAKGHGTERYRSNFKCVICARAEQSARYDRATATARKRAYRARPKDKESADE